MGTRVKEEGGERRSLLRAAGWVSGFTMVSRLLGLVRELVFAALLGAGMQADAFLIAFRIPNLLRDLFAEGALSAAFVPTFARAWKEGGREGAHQFAAKVATLLAAVMGVVVLAAYLATDGIVGLLAPGFADIGGKRELTRNLTRLMLPFLPLVSFAAVAMGMLNARERFRAPAFAPATFNIVAIITAAVLWRLGLSPDAVAVGWSIGVVLGGIAQLGVQLPALGKGGWRFSWEWGPGDPRIRELLSLMGPAVLGLAAVQINIFINSRFASYEPGAVSWLQYAFRLLYLPIGVIGVALGTIATAGFARNAAEDNLDALRQTLRRSLRLLLFLIVPATVGMVLLRAPIVRMIFERGRFGPEDTQATAAALAFYAVGLISYTGVKVLAPVFYALRTPRIALYGTVVAVAINIVAVLRLQPILGFRGVALATALGALANSGVLIVAFERSTGGLRGHGLVRHLGLVTVATLPMVVASLGVLYGCEALLGTQGPLAKLAAGILPVAVGLIAFMVAASLMRIPEADTIRALALRRRTA